MRHTKLVDSIEINILIERQRKLDMDNRGMQPLMMLTCLNSQISSLEKDEGRYANVGEVCCGCKNYESCRSYLDVLEVEHHPFKKYYLNKFTGEIVV